MNKRRFIAGAVAFLVAAFLCHKVFAGFPGEDSAVVPIKGTNWTALDSSSVPRFLAAFTEALSHNIASVQTYNCEVELQYRNSGHLVTYENFEEGPQNLFKYSFRQFRDDKLSQQLLSSFDGSYYQDYDFNNQVLTLDHKNSHPPDLVNAVTITTPFVFLNSTPNNGPPSLQKLRDILANFSWTAQLKNVSSCTIGGREYYKITIPKCYDPAYESFLTLQVILDPNNFFYPIEWDGLEGDKLLYKASIFSTLITLPGSSAVIPAPDRIHIDYYARLSKYQQISLHGADGVPIPYGASDYKFLKLQINNVDSDDFTFDPSLAAKIHDRSNDKWIQVPK